MSNILLPIPQEGNLTEWAQRVTEVLQSSLDSGEIVVSGGKAVGGVTMFDSEGRVLIDPDGLWIYDAAGNVPVSPNIVNIDTAQLVDAAITEPKIKNTSIGTAKIKNAAIVSALIADAAIVTAKIDDLAVNSAKIANLAVGSAKIDDLAVTNAKLANLAVDTAKISDAAITNAKIANLAVDTAQINTAAITNAKIANLAVDTAQIADAAISNAKIANLAVGTANIQDAAIATAKIGNLQVETVKVANQAITIPTNSYTSAGVTYNELDGEQTIQSLTFTSTGSPVIISMSLAAELAGGTSSAYTARLKRGATTIYTNWGATTQPMAAFQIEDTPGSGSVTYNLTAEITQTSSAINYRERTLVALEVKK